MSAFAKNSEPSLKYLAHFREVESTLVGSSPELLNLQRKKALEDFVRQGIPTRKNEDYKYTNLIPAFSLNYAFHFSRSYSNFNPRDIFKCDIPDLDTFLILLLNGWYHSKDTNGFSFPEGVITGSLERMAAKSPELFGNYYARLADTGTDPMVALNTAFARDGFFLYIPENTLLEKPVQVINLLQDESSSFVTQRNLVIAEPGAVVKLIICDHTLNLNHYLSNSVTEIYAGEGTSVDVCIVQNQHNKATSIHSVYVRQEKESSLTSHFVTLHGGLIRNNLKVMLEGRNCEANLYGMAFTDRKQHVDNFTQVVHTYPECRSNQHYKNVLDDESTGAFSGRIQVMENAQKSNAYQQNNNLLLTDKASMQTKPQLIIRADDVKCSHGATVGQIDEDALFYLRTRGIDEKQARMMLMNAFSYEVIKQIRIDPLRDRISDLIDKRLRGEVGRCHECAYQCECQ